MAQLGVAPELRLCAYSELGSDSEYNSYHQDQDDHPEYNIGDAYPEHLQVVHAGLRRVNSRQTPPVFCASRK
jgi:hypothetical protein